MASVETPIEKCERELRNVRFALKEAHYALAKALDTIKAREQQIDPDSVQHWDAMRVERDAARARLNGLAVMFRRVGAGSSFEALITGRDYDALVDEIAGWQL